MISVAVNIAANLALIPLIAHLGPPLATALSSTVNVTMLYLTLRKRGHFTVDAQLARRVPRLALAALVMGVAIWAGDGLLDPWLNGRIWERYAGLVILVGAGTAIYVAACFVTRAFLLSDLKALVRRRAAR
jgi:putative peptidoglycan lipid II flippase